MPQQSVYTAYKPFISKTIYHFNRVHKNEIAHRFAKVFWVDVFVKGSVFLLLPVYLHLMNQDEVGTFNYIYAFIQVFSIFLNFGLCTTQSKLYHEYTGVEREQLLFSINMVLLLAMALLLVPVYVLGLDFKLIHLLFERPIPYDQYRWPILLALITSVMSSMLFNFFLTSENIKRVQLYNLLRFFISNGVVLAILLFSRGDNVLTRLIIYYICELLLCFFFSISYIRQFSPVFNYKQIMHILSLSFPVFLLTLISTIQSFSDKFFIQQKADMSVMALYTTGVTIASVCSLIIQSFQSIWLPIFLKEKNIEANFRKTASMSKIIVFLFLGIALLMIAGVKVALICDVIPATYDNVLFILPFLFISQIILAVNTLYGNYFLYFERLGLGTIVGGGLYVLFFILNYLLIPRYGIEGALITLILGNTILLITVYTIVKSLYNRSRKYNHPY